MAPVAHGMEGVSPTRREWVLSQDTETRAICGEPISVLVVTKSLDIGGTERHLLQVLSRLDL